MRNMLNISYTQSHKGFSLAEMLLVLVILSFLIVSMAPIAYNKLPKKTDRIPHGRFECYYDGNQLMQYSADEIYGATTPQAVTKCEFNPPVKASFFIMQAIGGGAGGTYVTEDPNSTTPIYESGVINAPKTGQKESTYPYNWILTGTYSQENCTIADAGDAAGGSGGSCPTWLKSIWDTYPPSVTLDICAPGGTNGADKTITYEDGSTNHASGGSGAPGSCTKITTRILMDKSFSIDHGLDLGDGSINIITPDVSCTLGGGGNGTSAHISGSSLVSGHDGTTQPSTCSPITGSNSSNGSYTALADITYKRQGTKAATRYGHMGRSGEYVSMFFPGLTEALDITVGLGGNPGTSWTSPAGQDGGDTLIKLKNDTMTEAIRAKGGEGQAIGGSYYFWLRGGSPVSTGAVDADARFAVASGFSTFIELDETSNTPSKIAEKSDLIGMGGDGAYSIVRNTDSTEQIYIDGTYVKDEVYNSINKTQTYTCLTRDGATLTDDSGTPITLTGSQNVCPAQKGRNGAVVIVW